MPRKKLPPEQTWIWPVNVAPAGVDEALWFAIASSFEYSQTVCKNTLVEAMNVVLAWENDQRRPKPE